MYARAHAPVPTPEEAPKRPRKNRATKCNLTTNPNSTRTLTKSQPCVIPDGDPDYDGSVDWLNQLGYDVMNHHMPTFQPNAVNPYGVQCDHAWFAQFEVQGASVLRFFLEPVVRSINYATTLGYKRVVMTGLSGGGWSTTMLAAIDPRITLSLPVAGSMPCDFQHTSWDYEQLRGFFSTARGAFP